MGRVGENDKIRLLGQSWAMLQPSSFEGWGITVIEANACGTPVIASNVPGLRDSVVNGKTGILVPAGDDDKLAQAMISTISDAKTRRELSSRSIVWSKDFDWEIHSRKFINIISESLPKQDVSIFSRLAYKYETQ